MPIVSLCATSALIAALLSRSSVSPNTLGAPGPTRSELLTLIDAALVAPDHGALRPWRFILVEGRGRAELAQTFVQIRKVRNRTRAEELARIWRKAMRAPTLVAVVARLTRDHPNVPIHEQYISVGAALQGLMIACHALGYGAIMLSGKRSRNPLVAELFNLAPNEELVGFVSIGTLAKNACPKRRPMPNDHLEIWSGAMPANRPHVPRISGDSI